MTYKATHQPCDDCGSSDALTHYSNGNTYCFSCQTLKKGNNLNNLKEKIETELDYDFTTGHRTILSRGISKETCEKYNCIKDGTDTLFGYTDKEGNVIAYKKRNKDKEFRTSGRWTKSQLFGQHLYSGGQKYVTITEGEFDAMATFQMLGSRYPVVSIKNGGAGGLRDAKQNFEWLNSFENIVLCLDADEVGQRATQEIADLFGTKAKIFKHGVDKKDACDYITTKSQDEFIDRWWRAEQYVPDGIISGSSLLEEVMKPIASADVNYPFPELNKLTYGIRKGELVTVTAGSGLGKSQFIREIVYHILCKTKDNIGLLFLEESVRKTALSLMSLSANAPLHLPDNDISDTIKRKAFDDTLGTGKLFLFDHFGSTSVDNIVNRVRYMAKGLGCKYVFLDHVSIVVSAQASGDERRALDEIMTKLRMMVQETGIGLIVVSHLKRPDGKGHEEGAVTSLAQLRGSGSIAQLSDMVIGLERNGQHEDPIERNTTHVRVLKNRFCGITGQACSLLYNHNTGRMIERDMEEEI